MKKLWKVRLSQTRYYTVRVETEDEDEEDNITDMAMQLFDECDYDDDGAFGLDVEDVREIKWMKCKKHPLYKGIRKPKVDCQPCYHVWAHIQYDKFFKERGYKKELKHWL